VIYRSDHANPQEKTYIPSIFQHRACSRRPETRLVVRIQTIHTEIAAAESCAHGHGITATNHMPVTTRIAIKRVHGAILLCFCSELVECYIAVTRERGESAIIDHLNLYHGPGGANASAELETTVCWVWRVKPERIRVTCVQVH
jgi:hypothetical protein